MRRFLGLVAAIALLCAVPAGADFVYGGVTGVFARQAIQSGSPQTCTALLTVPAHGVQLTNASAAQTATLAVYDEGASPTCAAADLVYSAVLGANAQVALGVGVGYANSAPVFLTHGFAYTLSAAATGTISVQPF